MLMKAKSHPLSFILHPSCQLLVLLCLVLSGCSSTAPAIPTAPAQPQPSTLRASTRPPFTATATALSATPLPLTTPAAAVTAKVHTGLHIWVVSGEEQREPLLRLLNAAAAQAGVAVTLIPTSPDSLTMSTVAGTDAQFELPDLIWGNEDDLFILQRAGLIQPPDDGLDDTLFLPATLTGARAEGKRWGTPIAARGALFLLYNRKLVAAAPTTSDELIVRTREATTGERFGIVSAWVEGRWLEAWLRGAGTGSLSAASLSLDTPAMVRALDLLKELRNSGPPPPSTYSEGARLFREGKVAFAIDGDWSLARYRNYTETLDLGIAPLPRFSATGQPAVGPLGGLYLMQSTGLTGEASIQARLLARSLTGEAMQLRLARDLAVLPAQRALLGSSVISNDPALSAAARYAELAPGIPPLAQLRCAWTASEIMLPYLFLDEMDAQQTAKRLQEQAETCMSESQ